MTDERSSHEPRKRRRPGWVLPAVAVAVAWGGLIAATSSTVILPHDFFAWFASHVFTTDASYQGFVAFWGIVWFAVVKGWHAAEFAILFLLALAAANRLRRSSPVRNVLPAAGLCLLYAASDEYHQTFVPGRGGTVQDVLIDGLGIAAAAIFVLRRLRRRQAANVGPDEPAQPFRPRVSPTTGVDGGSAVDRVEPAGIESIGSTAARPASDDDSEPTLRGVFPSADPVRFRDPLR